MKRWLSCLGAAAVLNGAVLLAGEVRLTSLRIEPSERILRGAGARQQLLAVGHFEDGSERDLTGEARWTVSNPELAEVGPHAQLRAIANGAIIVSAFVQAQQTHAKFEAREIDATRAFEFGRDIG